MRRNFVFSAAFWLIAASFATAVGTPAVFSPDNNSVISASECYPVVIGHRGASGYVPEHTLGSYALAITLGADYIEPDLVMTKDGHLIARHDNELSLTTDVSTRPEFANRRRPQTVDGQDHEGWFTEDFTLAEIKTLRVKERIPALRPGNARMDGAFTIPTFQEILELAKSMELSQHRRIGIYPEIKHSTHFKEIGLPMEQSVVDTFHNNGYTGYEARVYIQSFEINNLKELNKMTDLKLLQLIDEKHLSPYDQVRLGLNLTYEDMSTREGLAEISKYADAVGPDKNYIIPRNDDNSLGTPTSYVKDAHEVGLKVHPYTFRAENSFLPMEYHSDNPSKSAFGDLRGEIQAFFSTGIDGLFADQPDIPLKVRGPCP